MCGICGIIGEPGWPAERGRNDCASMLNALHHRGPDVQQLQVTDFAALGHARLSIIDTDVRSNQPMFSLDRQAAIVFNGEIYNFEALKAELSAQGEAFSTTGDTEVLLRLLRKYGPEALPKLRGMFALAYVDFQQGSVLLARDPFGKKPLYWFEKEGLLHFSSELRSINRIVRSTQVADLAGFLMYQAPSEGTTFLSGINEIGAGCWLHWRRGVIRSGKHFSLAEAILGAEEQGAVSQEAFQHVFENAVKRRLIADVPLGAFLSGGIDSTAVVTAMVRQSAQPVRTFTIGFEGVDGDERTIAAETAARLGTEHTLLILKPEETVGWVAGAVSEMDVPSADALNTWIVSRVTRRAGITVALSGLGGDEWFGGYPSAGILKWVHLVPPPVSDLVRRLSNVRMPFSIRKMLLAAGFPSPEGVTAAARCVFDVPLLKELGIGAPAHRPEMFPELTPVNRLAMAEFSLYCKRLLLRDSDQMSMAHALELRVPFLDIDFLEVAARLNRFPPKRTEAHPKWKLIQSLPGYFPPALRNLPKKGFALPMERWMQGPLKDFVSSGLDAPALNGVLDVRAVKHWFELMSRNKSHPGWSRIWLIAVLGHWMERNRNGL